jgi:hypothetical protein
MTPSGREQQISRSAEIEIAAASQVEPAEPLKNRAVR